MGKGQRCGQTWLGDHLFVHAPETPGREIIERYVYWLMLCFGTGVLIDVGQWGGLLPFYVDPVVIPIEAGLGAVVLWRLVPNAVGSHVRLRAGIVLTSLGLAGVGIWDLPVSFLWIVVFYIGLWLVLHTVPWAPRQSRWRFWRRS